MWGWDSDATIAASHAHCWCPLPGPRLRANTSITTHPHAPPPPQHALTTFGTSAIAIKTLNIAFSAAITLLVAATGIPPSPASPSHRQDGEPASHHGGRCSPYAAAVAAGLPVPTPCRPPFKRRPAGRWRRGSSGRRAGTPTALHERGPHPPRGRQRRPPPSRTFARQREYVGNAAAMLPPDTPVSWT